MATVRLQGFWADEGQRSRMPAGGTVSTNVWVHDLDLPVPVNDARRLEIVVDGLPLRGGAQSTANTTLMSVLRGDGTVLGRGNQLDGVALRAARRRKERTYPELETWPKGEVSGPCWRSSRAVVGGDRLLLETTRQSAGEKRTSCAAEEGRAGVETSVGGRCWHVSLVHSSKRCPEVLTATPPTSTRSWESVVSLVWRQPGWLPGARS